MSDESYGAMVGKYSEVRDGDNYGCGIAERGHHGLIKFVTSQGTYRLPYGTLCGVDESGTEATLHFDARLTLKDKAESGPYAVTIKGERLGWLLDKIAQGKMLSVHPGPAKEEGHSTVTSIEIVGEEE